MKKIRFVLITIAIVTVCWMCAEIIFPVVDYGTSNIYSQEEMDSAIKIIQNEFLSWEGCKLYAIQYTSDYTCAKELEYCNSLNKNDAPFVECIVFKTIFRSPLSGGGAWTANRIYDWTWYLAQTKNGSWELLTWGV